MLLRPSELRMRAGDRLAPDSDDDPEVIVGPVDAVHPPCYVLEWNDPWLEYQTMKGTAGLWYAGLVVVCLTGRLDPLTGTEDLEQMAAFALGVFASDPGYSWPLQSTAAPRFVEYAGVQYLAARIAFRAPVTLNGG